MTIYGQTLGVFKRQNNECILAQEQRQCCLKIKIVVFLILGMWWYDFIMMYFVTKYKFHDKGINWT